MRLTPPTKLTFMLSILIAIGAFLVKYVPVISTYVPVTSFWIAIAAFVLLALGNVLRGF